MSKLQAKPVLFLPYVDPLLSQRPGKPQPAGQPLLPPQDGGLLPLPPLLPLPLWGSLQVRLHYISLLSPHILKMSRNSIDFDMTCCTIWFCQFLVVCNILILQAGHGRREPVRHDCPHADQHQVGGAGWGGGLPPVLPRPGRVLQDQDPPLQELPLTTLPWGRDQPDSGLNNILNSWRIYFDKLFKQAQQPKTKVC